MSIEKDLLVRAGGRCEICSSTSALAAYDVTGNPRTKEETQVLLCQTCRDHLETPASLDSGHWYGLAESAWSEHDAVKVLVHRILRRLNNPWSLDLLNQMYLDEDLEAWADSGLIEEAKQSQTQVVDSNGTLLQNGDSVTLIKDLDVKGANFTAKRGTMVKNIALTDDPKYIEGRVNGTRIVLVAAYLKKS